MSDKRAELLAWLDEQERLCAAAMEAPWAVADTTAQGCYWIVGRAPVGERSVEVSICGRGDWPLRAEHSAANGRFIAASRTVLPLALAALRGEVEAHDPWGIYDECGHDHGRDYDNMDPKVHDIEGVGLVCDNGLVQRVCRVCHLTNDEPREDTSDAEWPCSTIQRLHAALLGEKS